MLNTADILINRQPIGALGRIIDACKASEIPAGIIECIERIGFALRRFSTFWTVDIFPCRVVDQRIAGFLEADIVGQFHRQIALWNRNNAAAIAMDDGNWTAPIALPRHAPIAQPIIHCAFAELQALDFRNGERFCVSYFFAVEVGGIHDCARPRIGGIHVFTFARRDPSRRGRILIARTHHRQDRQVILAGKIEVALIMRRACENGARAIAHEHEIRDIYRQS